MKKIIELQQVYFPEGHPFYGSKLLTIPNRALPLDIVMAAIRAYYAKPGNEAGGCLHIVLDDGNLETSHVEFCKQYAQENGDSDGVSLAEMLLNLSYAEREKLFLADKTRK